VVLVVVVVVVVVVVFALFWWKDWGANKLDIELVSRRERKLWIPLEVAIRKAEDLVVNSMRNTPTDSWLVFIMVVFPSVRPISKRNEKRQKKKLENKNIVDQKSKMGRKSRSLLIPHPDRGPTVILNQSVRRYAARKYRNCFLKPLVVAYDVVRRIV
jgi:hypothetical protein